MWAPWKRGARPMRVSVAPSSPFGLVVVIAALIVVNVELPPEAVAAPVVVAPAHAGKKTSPAKIQKAAQHSSEVSNMSDAAAGSRQRRKECESAQYCDEPLGG